jgi:hypothetical protein
LRHDHASERETVANQIYNQAIITEMIDKCTRSGESIDKAIGWAAPARRRMTMKKFVRRMSTTAFVMALARLANP